MHIYMMYIINFWHIIQNKCTRNKESTFSYLLVNTCSACCCGFERERPHDAATPTSILHVFVCHGSRPLAPLASCTYAHGHTVLNISKLKN